MLVVRSWLLVSPITNLSGHGPVRLKVGQRSTWSRRPDMAGMSPSTCK